jgi:hypothetical protein
MGRRYIIYGWCLSEFKLFKLSENGIYYKNIFKTERWLKTQLQYSTAEHFLSSQLCTLIIITFEWTEFVLWNEIIKWSPHRIRFENVWEAEKTSWK